MRISAGFALSSGRGPYQGTIELAIQDDVTLKEIDALTEINKAAFKHFEESVGSFLAGIKRRQFINKEMRLKKLRQERIAEIREEVHKQIQTVRDSPLVMRL